jgi:MYXO-CTERM domain-containing protein
VPDIPAKALPVTMLITVAIGLGVVARRRRRRPPTSHPL